MDWRRVLKQELFDRAERYAEQRFGKCKLALLVRVALEEYLERNGG